MLDVKSRLQDLKSVAEKLAIEIEIVNLNNLTSRTIRDLTSNIEKL